MESNAWYNEECICSVCGLPFRSADQRGWILDVRALPLPPEFDNEDAIIELAKNELWLDDVVLLCDPDDEMGALIPSFAYEELRNYGNQSRETHPSSLHLGQPVERSSAIEEHEAAHMGGPCFYLYEPSGAEREVNIHHWDFPTFDGRSYIPIHSACLTLAKRVIAHSAQTYMRSLRSLFLALRWRHAVSRKSGETREKSNYELGSSYWYRPYWDFWELGDYYEGGNSKARWPGPTNDAEFNVLYTFLSDPMEIRNLTETLLANLEPYRHDADDTEARQLRAHLLNLPEDILHIILSHLRTCRELPRTPTYTLPQSFWKDELMRAGKGLLPWLWDIEPNKVNSKASEPCPGEDDLKWNWELLVRQLSRGVDGGIRPDVPEHIDVYASSDSREQYKFTEDLWTFTGPADDIEYVPKGLHNRRRVWQLLEEMFVGDHLPVAGESYRDSEQLLLTEQCVELPWTKQGGLRESAVWLPVIQTNKAFVRRSGGAVYAIANKARLQYWQTREFRMLHGEEWEEPVEPASVVEILKVIRKLGYPV
ncbi:hypothetical protein F4802DRAFT_590282 [Xylaria palmicola]|nr:hypothetical protein F4802DRAFT_590282 [Xylaria palmicola]